MQLQLIVADFHLDPGELSAAAAETLPRLPGLEAVLRLGRRVRLAQDWREFLARHAGRADLALAPPAQVAAVALGMSSGSNPWFAAPVHLHAGMDHLRLHPAGLLVLQPEELEALAADFAQTFAGAGLMLRPLFRGFVLTGLAARDAVTRDPACFLGADIARAPASGAQAAELRRLGTEIEMWLHGSEFNRARARRGMLAVSGLWLWGGGQDTGLSAGLRHRSLSLPRAYADDGYVAGLWHACGGEAQSLPQDFDALLADPELVRSPAAVVVSVSAAATGPRDAPLASIDARWIGPALRALRAGRLSQLSLYCGGLQLAVVGRDRLRFWRSARPWWEAFAT